MRFAQAQKISKFKPLIAQAHEALARSPARLPGKGFAKSPLTSSVAHHGISRGAGHKRESFESLNDGLGPWNTDDASTPKHGAFFPNLQVACKRRGSCGHSWTSLDRYHHRVQGGLSFTRLYL